MEGQSYDKASSFFSPLLMFKARLLRHAYSHGTNTHNNLHCVCEHISGSIPGILQVTDGTFASTAPRGTWRPFAYYWT